MLWGAQGNQTVWLGEARSREQRGPGEEQGLGTGTCRRGAVALASPQVCLLCVCLRGWAGSGPRVWPYGGVPREGCAVRRLEVGCPAEA